MNRKINFDSSGNPEKFTYILSKRNGEKIGVLNDVKGVIRISLNSANEVTFNVQKYLNGEKNFIWDEILDLRLLYCLERDEYYEISVEVNEDNDCIKTVSATSLCETELGQIMLYNYEINTEDDIAREDYIKPTIFYDSDSKISLLNRLIEKAPHYSINHVDQTLRNIQRSFSFDNISIYDALQQVSDEIGCIFIFDSGEVKSNSSKIHNHIKREINVYDLWDSCKECGYRGEYLAKCPKCGSSDIKQGYGEDTNIFITSDEIADSLSIKADVDSVKNCFKLEAGDDLMTATIRNINPNGTDYIWNITNYVLNDMSDELSDKIKKYNELYKEYENDYMYSFRAPTRYNNVIKKYSLFDDRFIEFENPVIGYSSLMNQYYDAIDLDLFIQTELMPNASLDDTSALEQAQLITPENIGEIAVSNISSLTQTIADSAILGYLKCIIDNRYSCEIVSSSLQAYVWTGVIKISNNSDKDDNANSDEISITINDEYESYVRQKVEKVFSKQKIDNVSISGIFKLDLDEFKNEMKKYCIDMLKNFHDSCQAGIDILMEQGVGTKETWAGESPNLYDDLYVPYYDKLKALESEIYIKETDLNVVKNIEEQALGLIKETQSNLDFQSFLGEDLWLEFSSFRREQKFSNDNYISDGLNNKELFNNARLFFEDAKKNIEKSSELQYSISSSLKNLLVIKKFSPIVDFFEEGNWIRVQINDEIKKLRILEYEIDFGKISDLSVEFSDVLNSAYGFSDQQSVILSAKSMSSTYAYTQRQAGKGEKSSDVIDDWQNNGLDATSTQIIGGSDNQNQVWDSHGILLRKYDNIEDRYEDNQMKIVNSTIAITNDNWETVKTAIGYYFYTDNNGELKSAYGINAETIIGKLVLGNELYFSNENNTMTFDKNGLVVSNGINSFIVNPDDVNLLKIKNGEEDVFYVDQDGKLHITGDGTYIDVTGNETIEEIKTDILSMQKTAHSHENKEILDDIEAAYKIVEQEKLAGITSITNLELEELLK